MCKKLQGISHRVVSDDCSQCSDDAVDAPRTYRRADGITDDIFKLMRFVKDNNIVFWQELAVHCDVQSVDKRINNHYVGNGCRCSCLFRKAPVCCGATLRAWALIATNTDKPPGFVAGAPRQVALVTCFGLVGPFNELSDFSFHCSARIVQI